MFSDLGWLWDRYHKESHDKWKVEIGNLEESLAALEGDIGAITQSLPATAPEAAPRVKLLPSYSKEVTIESGSNKETTLTEKTATESKPTLSQPSVLIKIIGFLLQQKAILVFAGFAFLVYCIDLLLRGILTLASKSAPKSAAAKHKRKDGGYQYSRK